jgi:hypothetical protein
VTAPVLISADADQDADDDDDTSYAPESGQPRGGRDNPWDDDDGTAWPPPRHAAPKDEL